MESVCRKAARKRNCQDKEFVWKTAQDMAQISKSKLLGTENLLLSIVSFVIVLTIFNALHIRYGTRHYGLLWIAVKSHNKCWSEDRFDNNLIYTHCFCIVDDENNNSISNEYQSCGLFALFFFFFFKFQTKYARVTINIPINYFLWGNIGSFTPYCL